MAWLWERREPEEIIMTLDKYWVEVEKLRVLPQMAIKQLPSSLSMETKKRLLKLKPDVTVE